MSRGERPPQKGVRPLTKPKKKGLLSTLYQNRVAYVYIAPFYILFLVFNLFPMAAGFLLSFFRWDGLSDMHFIGLQNYGNLFGDPLFWKALWNTLFIGIIAHIPILMGGLILAYILNSKLVKFNNLFKTILIALSLLTLINSGNNLFESKLITETSILAIIAIVFATFSACWILFEP